MFAHVLPLVKVYLVWDALFMGPKNLAVAMAVAIVQQVRQPLLLMDFSQALHLCLVPLASPSFPVSC